MAHIHTLAKRAVEMNYFNEKMKHIVTAIIFLNIMVEIHMHRAYKNPDWLLSVVLLAIWLVKDYHFHTLKI